MGGASSKSILVSIVVILIAAVFSVTINMLNLINPLSDQIARKSQAGISEDANVYNVLGENMLTAQLVYRVITTYDFEKDENGFLKVKVITEDGELKVQDVDDKNNNGDRVEFDKSNLNLLLTKYSSKYFTARLDDTDTSLFIFEQSKWTGKYKEEN